MMRLREALNASLVSVVCSGISEDKASTHCGRIVSHRRH